MSDPAQISQLLAEVAKALTNSANTSSKVLLTLLEHESRISALEHGLAEELSEEEEDHPTPRKGHPTQVLLGQTKEARQAYRQTKNP